MSLRKSLLCSALFASALSVYALAHIAFGQGLVVTPPSTPPSRVNSTTAMESPAADWAPKQASRATSTTNPSPPRPDYDMPGAIDDELGPADLSAVEPTPPDTPSRVGARTNSQVRKANVSATGGNYQRGALGGYYRGSQAEPLTAEMIKLLESDAEMNQGTQQLVQQYQRADASAKTNLRLQLEDLSKEHFDVRQKRRELEISNLEKQLLRVKASMKKREDNKDLIIQRHLSTLLGEEDDLAF